MLRGNLQPAAGVIENQLLQVLLFILPRRAVKLFQQQVIPYPAADKGFLYIWKRVYPPVKGCKLPV